MTGSEDIADDESFDKSIKVVSALGVIGVNGAKVLLDGAAVAGVYGVVAGPSMVSK